MRLKGVEFNNVFGSSGVLNFFGQGWNHPLFMLYRLLFKKWYDFSGATLITKTTTWPKREGSMPLDGNYQPTEFFIDCIRVNFLKGVVLNSVGLSGPGAEKLFEDGFWQQIDDSFLISFMSLGDTFEQKMTETEFFVRLLARELPKFWAKIGVQVNVSCPNTEHATRDMLNHSFAILEPFQGLGIPIDLKVGVADVWGSEGIDFVKKIEMSGLCDCLTCSNTIPWGRMPEFIDWVGLFGSGGSPLAHLGGGGLSGKPLLPIVSNWIWNVRQAGVTMPIKIGGGILSPKDVLKVARRGASGIEIGCASILRPWKIKGIIQTANDIRGEMWIQ